MMRRVLSWIHLGDVGAILKWGNNLREKKQTIFLKFDKCKMLGDIQGKGQVVSWIHKSGLQSGSPG